MITQKGVVTILAVACVALAFAAILERNARHKLKTELADFKAGSVFIEGFPGGYLYKSTGEGENLRAKFRWIKDCKWVASVMNEDSRDHYFCTEGRVDY